MWCITLVDGQYEICEISIELSIEIVSYSHHRVRHITLYFVPFSTKPLGRKSLFVHFRFLVATFIMQVWCHFVARGLGCKMTPNCKANGSRIVEKIFKNTMTVKNILQNTLCSSPNILILIPLSSIAHLLSKFRIFHHAICTRHPL